MISLIEKVIKDNKLEESNKAFEFLKYSTPSSGKRLDDKVVFFVFRKGEKKPFLCVKSVRYYGARETVIRNFNNLEMLQSIVVGTKFINLFAKPLYLYDDGENIFSFETVCQGYKHKFDKKKLERVVGEYTEFQSSLTPGAHEITSLKDYAQVVVMRSGLKPADQHEILGYIDKRSFGSTRLPRIMQHGDITQDNILLAKNHMSIVDCDFINKVDLPGFDLFGLFYRFDRVNVKALCHQYLPRYFVSIGATVMEEDYENLFFVYYLIERTIRKPYQIETTKGIDVINDFRNI